MTEYDDKNVYKTQRTCQLQVLYVSISDYNYFLEFFKKSGMLISTGFTLLVGCAGF